MQATPEGATPEGAIPEGAIPGEAVPGGAALDGMATMAPAYGEAAVIRQGRREFILAAYFVVTIMTPAMAAPIRLLILGDSLTAGYGLPREDGFQAVLAAALRQHGIEIALIDGAVSGDTSAGGVARLDWVLADGADAAIVELGANDGLRALDPKETERNLTAILDRLAASHVKVLFSGMYPLANFGPDYTREFRAVFDRLGKRPDVIYDPFFLDGVALEPALIQPDGLHPNAQGVARIVGRLLPLVLRLLAEVRPS